MKIQKLFILLALFAFALAPVAVQAQDTVDLPKVTIATTADSEIPKAIPVVEDAGVDTIELTAPDSPVIPDAVEAFVLDKFVGIAMKHSWLATLILIMGTCRVFAKPFSSLVHSLVDMTPSKADDGVLNSIITFFHENTVGKFLAYVVDWLTSIKIKAPEQKK